MDVDYPPPRVEVSPKQAIAALAVVVTLCAVWVAAHTRGETGPPEQIAAATEDTWQTGTTGTPGSPGVTGQPGANGMIVVSVVGAVDKPGLVTLNSGSRVADALAVAHPQPDADLLTLNQAQVLIDGQQILVLAKGQAPPVGAVGASAAGGGGSGGAAGAGTISLNSATASQLTELPGVGDATAAAIIAHREANGPFTSVEQLMDVKGIGQAKFDAVKDLVVL
ncbi:ComE operon protein 1 [Corynebacterium aquatimens]|nr:ComE operon protein 1 [Corynebacterium aquatimens]